MARAEVTMLRALLWKEWREQRSLVLAGLALAALLPLVVLAGATATSGAPTLRRVAEVLLVTFAVFLWPLAALASGASVFAEERSSATSGFLLSRPVRRPLIWMAKVLVAAFSTALIVAGSIIVAFGLHSLARGAATMEATLTNFDGTLDATARAVFGPAPLFLVFAAAIYFSTHRARPLTATISGLLASLLLVSLIVTTWPLVGLRENIRDIWVAIEISVAATLLLIASGRRFASEEALSATSNVKALVSLAGIGLLTALSGFAPAMHADVFADWKTAAVARPILDRAGPSIIVEAGASSSIHGAIWRLGIDGTERRLARRMSFGPFVSPDGEWIYYLSRRGPFGLASRRVDLRAVRPDGSDDRRIAAGLGLASSGQRWWLGSVLFSPSGSMLVSVYASPEGLLIVDLEHGRAERHDTGAFAALGLGLIREVRSLAWIDDAEILLLVATTGGASQAVALVRFDVETRQARLVHVEGGGFVYADLPEGYLDSRPAPRRFPVVFHSWGEALPSSTVVVGIDLETGSHERIASYACGSPQAAMSASGRVLAFTRHECEADAEGKNRVRRAELYVRDLETGDERGPIAAARSLGNLAVSPGGDRIHVGVSDGPAGLPRSLIIEGDGTRRELPLERLFGGWPRYSEAGWLDDRRLLLSNVTHPSDVVGPWRGPAWLAIIDAGNGAVIAEHLWE
jgi:hypothetical protein